MYLSVSMQNSLCKTPCLQLNKRREDIYQYPLCHQEREVIMRQKTISVKLEHVVLNKSGKRAIRLDAWAQDIGNRQFDMEMQNDSDSDDLRKRSRFYQGLIDSPLLKSGKKTRYRQLPSTMIIFITIPIGRETALR